jgi:DNA-binding response OmpR family regulator
MPHKILIVDDDHDTHAFIHDLLEMYGYEVDCVHRSDEARKVISRFAPDMLILDLHIEQRYAGWTLFQALRVDPATAAIPAILCTSDTAFIAAHQEAVRAQGGELVQKPFNPDVLVGNIATRLNG